MVKNSDKTYGQLILEAKQQTDRQEVGETVGPLMDRLKGIIEDAAQKQYAQGTTGKFYIHIVIVKDPMAANVLKILPQCRRTRPSPYQGHDHYLWSVESGVVKFEWCIPSKEVLKYILANPTKFDAKYVAMLRNFCKDKLEKIEDYMVNGKIA
jgi:hypothetical protein